MFNARRLGLFFVVSAAAIALSGCTPASPPAAGPGASKPAAQEQSNASPLKNDCAKFNAKKAELVAVSKKRADLYLAKDYLGATTAFHDRVSALQTLDSGFDGDPAFIKALTEAITETGIQATLASVLPDAAAQGKTDVIADVDAKIAADELSYQAAFDKLVSLCAAG